MKKRGLALAILSVSALLLALGISVRAWFVMSAQKEAQVVPTAVDKPPTISVLDNETTSSDEILNMDGLQVGRPKCVVFCVTPSIQGTVSEFKLQLAYTANMGAQLDLYACDYYGTEMPNAANDAEAHYTGVGNSVPVSGDYVTVPSKQEGSTELYYYRLTDNMLRYTESVNVDDYEATDDVESCNVPTYKRYNDSSDGGAYFRFDNIASQSGLEEDNWNNGSRFKFFVLYIHWPEGAGEGVNNRETDIVYVSAKGIL